MWRAARDGRNEPMHPMLRRAAVVLLVAVTAACSSGTDTSAPTPTPTPTPSGPASTSASAGTVRPVVAGTVATGLSAPWGVAFLPDGSALVTERDRADVVRVGTDGSVVPVGTVPGVRPDGEGGLLGIALDPNFATEPWVYVYFTGENDNRIVRIKYADDELGALQVVLSGLAKAAIHDGGRIAFGPDGYLYAGIGDVGNGDLAQDLGSLNGKILRITTDGDPAPGNPFPGSPVYSYGHRNVQGLAWDSRDQLWATEFGQNTWDELNQIRARRQLRLAGGRGTPATTRRTSTRRPSGRPRRPRPAASPSSGTTSWSPGCAASACGWSRCGPATRASRAPTSRASTGGCARSWPPPTARSGWSRTTPTGAVSRSPATTASCASPRDPGGLVLLVDASVTVCGHQPRNEQCRRAPGRV